MLKLIEKIGEIIQQNVDRFDVNTIFRMKSIYYECEIDTNNKSEQYLDEYEKEEEFAPVFMDLDNTVQQNEKVISKNNKNTNDWVVRESKVLKFLKYNNFMR
ncbi:hypothetical protein [Clostridium guangxiense]|uniref:hypothetical protein n=1 Tax=Clostridium guangxiense TaxID=1662055 RepID=UPI001E5C47FB|nr:hypothetical protein [Clostridium guangxiense]MCD2346550.1 hypothetical protein [Clostridium guangxiense]